MVTLTIIGIATLGMAWMPSFTKTTGISDSVVYVVLGVIVYGLLDILPNPNPLTFNVQTIHLTELVVVVSLMGTGLKIDKPFSFKAWSVPFRMLTITMVLCIAAVSMIAYYFLRFDLASALLLGAVLAPTDPVLAADVQVGPPMEQVTDEVRFSLTAEAGMNDGMAFPFTWLAILLAGSATGEFGEILGDWFQIDLAYKIVVGIALGILLGRVLAYVIFNFSEKRKSISLNDGFIAVAAALAIFGLVELIGGYGFVAVFVAAVTMRNYEFNHQFHKDLHSFSDQTERILVAIVLLIFGGSIVHGILDHLTWPYALLSLFFLLIIRPVSSLIALIGTKLHFKERMGIGFYGIRGVGSFYYLAFALSKETFLMGNELWSTVSFIVLLSVAIHGLTATRVMTNLEKKFSKSV
ncbi:cation:proton antiporter [Dyadobacter fanqingshengii]|uniref:Cation:proton antiporter n=1 Tax=Dyadobacter fanqingshengii TaxID=2906443 RepID=A0A9X1PC94_9BACT|nr:cation:proton antiporter [Dyadobacter fanqingshengii]MCF0041018.1 cation:proton antiporter [Dyadobacter fanqingshengii]USJ37251.1 cation:proton antiporter [Dyadobacter fanqingshengii]